MDFPWISYGLFGCLVAPFASVALAAWLLDHLVARLLRLLGSLFVSSLWLLWFLACSLGSLAGPSPRGNRGNYC